MLRMWSLCRSNNEKAMNWAAVFQLHSLIPFVDFASTWGIPVLFTPLFEEQTQYSWIEKCILGIAFIVRLRRFFSPWGRLKSIFERLYCSSPTGFLATNNYKLVYYRFMTWTQFYKNCLSEVSVMNSTYPSSKLHMFTAYFIGSQKYHSYTSYPLSWVILILKINPLLRMTVVTKSIKRP